MFGYIKPYEDELKVRHFKLYRSIYCGLCKSAGRHNGIFSRFFLSYDYTFFAIVRMIFEKTEITTEKARCGFHLFSKKDIISDNKPLELSAAVFSVLTYYKLLDNIKDEGFIKSLMSKLLLPVASHMKKRSQKNGFGDVELIIRDGMEKIAALEKSSRTNPVEISEAFGEMLGYLLKLGLCEEDRDDAYRIGFETGRFIYNCDAIDDMEKDEKSGSFNPFLNEYKDREKAFSEIIRQRNLFTRGTDIAADIISERKKKLCGQLRNLCETAQNILYLGCPAVLGGILNKNTGIKENRKEHTR